MTSETLARSDYIGWVAWVGETPIFEAVPAQPAQPSLAPGARALPHRAEARNVVDWKELPHERVTTLELYAFRDAFRTGGPYQCGQPVVRIDRMPETVLRWIQMKHTGQVVEAGAGGVRRNGLGPQRLGVTAWTVGYWDERLGYGEIWRVEPTGKPPKRHTLLVHPCKSREVGGLGLAPHVLGLQTAP